MSLLKNNFIILTGVIISNGIAYIFHLLSGRYLGPEEYGIFGALLSILVLLNFPSSSLSFAIAKFTSEFKTENNYSKIDGLRYSITYNVLKYSIIISLIVLLAIFLKPDLVGNQSFFSLILVLIGFIFSNLLSIDRGFIQGLKKFITISWSLIIEAITRIIILVFAILGGFGINGVIIAFIAGYILSYILTIIFFKKISSSPMQVTKINLSQIHLLMYKSFLANIFLQLLINLPSIFLVYLDSAEYAGYWTASINIAKILLVITGVVSMVMIPEISGLKDDLQKKKTFIKSILLTLLISVIGSIFLFIFPKFIIQILYGNNFLQAVNLLPWMGIGMIFISLIQLWINYKLANDPKSV